mgnify:FL=1
MCTLYTHFLARHCLMAIWWSRWHRFLQITLAIIQISAKIAGDLHHGIRNNVLGLGENALLWKRNSLMWRYMSSGSEFVGTHRLIPSPSIKSRIKANSINNQNTFVNQINANADYNLLRGVSTWNNSEWENAFSGYLHENYVRLEQRKCKILKVTCSLSYTHILGHWWILQIVEDLNWSPAISPFFPNCF